jgi:lipopolysaccharide assembly outer membrane protein LptD (OstA)
MPSKIACWTGRSRSSRVRVSITLALLFISVATVQGQQVTTFSVADSVLVSDLDSDSIAIHLQGAVEIERDGTVLRAGHVTVFTLERTLVATAGEGGIEPTILQGEDTFSGRRMTYDLESGIGRIEGGTSEIDEGFIQADIVRSDGTTTYLSEGRYTTCPCVEDPSWSIQSPQMKLKDDWIYTGPLQLFLFKIPTPLWLPFGVVPAVDGRRSGLLAPQYGEDERGFYLRNWGWYAALSDYADLTLRGGIWSLGSWQADAQFRYNVRYRFQGALDFSLGKHRNGLRRDPDFSIFTTTAIRWQHQQTISSRTRLSANVNLAANSYLRSVSQSFEDRATQQLQSTVRFSTRLPGPNLQIDAAALHRQQLSSGNVTLSLPTVSLKLAERPVRKPTSTTSWLDNLRLSYSGSVENQFSYSPLSDAERYAAGDSTALPSWWNTLFNPTEYRRATGMSQPLVVQATHRIPLTFSHHVQRIGPLRTNIQVGANLDYQERWFSQTNRLQVVDSLRTISQTQTVPGFFALRTFQTRLQAGTRIYGVFPFGPGRITAIRHTLRPSLGMAFQPDFSKEFWGYTRLNPLNDSPYGIVSGVPVGPRRAIDFSLQQTLEAKRERIDDPSQVDNINLLQLNLRSGYNLAADSLRFEPIAATARMRIGAWADVSLSTTLTPYARGSDGRLINTSLLRMGKTPLQVLQWTVTSRSQLQRDDQRLSFDISLSESRYTSTTVRRGTANLSLSTPLTPAWSMRLRSGYDVIQQEIATTSLSMDRTFDCWDLSFQWIPFGRYQSYSFDLRVKTGPLRELLRIQQPRQDVQGLFSGL